MDRRNLISRRVAVYTRATSASRKPTQRASARYRRHQIYISFGEEPTGAWFAIAATNRAAAGQEESARANAIIINNSAAQCHAGTMGVLSEGK